MIPRLGLLAAAALAVGCNPVFHAISAPPLAKTARLDSRAETIELSPGVALAFECLNPAGDPCEKATASVDDPKVAGVAPAYLDRLSASWRWRGPQPQSGFVVWGVAAGKTVIRVRSDSGDAELEVRIVDDG